MGYEDNAIPLTLDGELSAPRAQARQEYIEAKIAENKEAYREAFGTEGLPPDEEDRVLAVRLTAALVLLDVETTIGFALPHVKRSGTPSRHDPLARLNWATLNETSQPPAGEEAEFVHYEVRPTADGLLALNGLRERLGMPSAAQELVSHRQSLRQQDEEIRARLPVPRPEMSPE